MTTTTGVWEDVAPLATRTLDPEHYRILNEESGISDDIIASRGYHSLTKLQITLLVQAKVVHTSILRGESWMGIPIWRPDGTKHGEIIRQWGGDPKLKYVWPTGTRLAFDVHPDTFADLGDVNIPVIFTEGIKKADAILTAARAEGFACVVIALNGCDGWRAKTEGSSTASPDFYDIAWTERHVYINSDSDYRTNPRVSGGWNGCANYVSGKTGEHRTLLVVTPPHGIDKQGADDWLARGNTLRNLLGEAQSPREAYLDQAGERTPLKLKSGMQLIRESGDKIPHLLAPLIPERAIVLMAGHSGTYKTWHALGLALDGAFGLPWLGHPGLDAEYGPFTTLYVNKEMSGSILGQRLKTLARNERYISNPDWEQIIENRIVFADEAALDLNVADQRDRLEDAIHESGAKLVVLDSLSMCWHGDENSSTEVGLLYAELRGIIERTGCTFHPLHHLTKPQGGRKREEHVSQFAVRGSGQLMQQADAAVFLSLYTDRLESSEETLVAMHHGKARTSREMPAWVSRFSSNDGLFDSIGYLCKLSEARAHAYAESNGDVSKLQAWVVEELSSMSGMTPGTGMRFKQLVPLLQQSWTVEGRSAPTESTLRRTFKELTEAGYLIKSEENKRYGDMFVLNDADPEEEELIPTTPPK